MGQLSVAGVKVVAGSVALPIMLAGSTATAGGSAVAELGSDMWQSANAPLEVSPKPSSPNLLRKYPMMPNRYRTR